MVAPKSSVGVRCRFDLAGIELFDLVFRVAHLGPAQRQNVRVVDVYSFNHPFDDHEVYATETNHTRKGTEFFARIMINFELSSRGGFGGFYGHAYLHWANAISTHSRRGGERRDGDRTVSEEADRADQEGKGNEPLFDHEFSRRSECYRDRISNRPLPLVGCQG